jgi:hypothetical protein
MKSNSQSLIIFLTHESGAARLLAETLAGTVGISGIVVESRWNNRFKHRLRQMTGDQLFEHLYSIFTLFRHGNLERRMRLIEGQLKNQSIRELHERLGRRKFSWPAGVSIFKTTQMNNKATYKWRNHAAPPTRAHYSGPPAQ